MTLELALEDRHRLFVPPPNAPSRASKSKPASTLTWCWKKSILPEQEEAWNERLRAAGCLHWAAVQKPGQVRISLQSYFIAKTEAVALAKAVGSGRVTSLATKAWLKPGNLSPIKIGSRLRIVHEAQRSVSLIPHLVIPYGMAFGSGEHSTTLMLLHALARKKSWEKMRVLDLGTGSGVLALAARRFGAVHVRGIDFDPDSVRTSRKNEVANFSVSTICWQQLDVKRLPAKPKYDLVVANLFSGILCEAAGTIARSVIPGGELLLSGILRHQASEVAAAYRRQRLVLVETKTRGKWIMQHWRAKA